MSKTLPETAPGKAPPSTPWASRPPRSVYPDAVRLAFLVATNARVSKFPANERYWVDFLRNDPRENTIWLQFGDYATPRKAIDAAIEAALATGEWLKDERWIELARCAGNGLGPQERKRQERLATRRLDYLIERGEFVSKLQERLADKDAQRLVGYRKNIAIIDALIEVGDAIGEGA